MKKITLLITSLLLILVLFTVCSSSKEKINVNSEEKISIKVQGKDVREMAFNQLTQNDKKRISGNWKDGKLSKVTLKEGMGSISDKSYIGKEVYLIDFPTKSISKPNNMIVYLGTDSSKLIGYGYVD